MTPESGAAAPEDLDGLEAALRGVPAVHSVDIYYATERGAWVADVLLQPELRAVPPAVLGGIAEAGLSVRDIRRQGLPPHAFVIVE